LRPGSGAKKKSPQALNRGQMSGAIFLPLRMRLTHMPLLICNTHLACNALDFDLAVLFVFSLLYPPLHAMIIFIIIITEFTCLYLPVGIGKFDHPTFQLAQASLLMDELIRLREHQPRLPIVFCGDLNSTRQSLVREYILHGMPPAGDSPGHFNSPAGPFSEVWQREFNKTCDKRAAERDRVWTEDGFPWQQLWFNETKGATLLPRNKNFPLEDAFEDLHNDEEAFTNPGEHLIIDHMCAQAAALGQFCFPGVTTFPGFLLPIAYNQSSCHKTNLYSDIWKEHESALLPAPANRSHPRPRLLILSAAPVTVTHARCSFLHMLYQPAVSHAAHQIVPHLEQGWSEAAPNAALPSDHCPLVRVFKFCVEPEEALVSANISVSVRKCFC
jgi:hypothetical protein